jgi:hypothetical protein
VPWLSNRYIYLGLGLLAIAARLVSFAIEGKKFPGPVESVSQDGSESSPDHVVIDLEVGYDAQIYVDDWLVTDATFVEGRRLPVAPGLQPTINGGLWEHDRWSMASVARPGDSPGRFEWADRPGIIAF